MQEKTQRRSNLQRTEETKGKLIAAARALFVEKGYAETGTPEIVKRAQVTRGALYHHFADKADLLRAVVTTEAAAVTEQINAKASVEMPPITALLTGASAYFEAMRHPGRAQILLRDGPMVLGLDAMAQIDKDTGGGGLEDGLSYLAEQHAAEFPIAEMAQLLSAMFERAALCIAQGDAAEPFLEAIEVLLRGLTQTAAD